MCLGFSSVVDSREDECVCVGVWGGIGHNRAAAVPLRKTVMGKEKEKERMMEKKEKASQLLLLFPLFYILPA